MYVIVEWILENTFSIIAFTAIASPRKEFDGYRVGEEVQAKFKGKCYPARIMNTSHNKKLLESKLQSVIEGIDNNVETDAENGRVDETLQDSAISHGHDKSKGKRSSDAAANKSSGSTGTQAGSNSATSCPVETLNMSVRKTSDESDTDDETSSAATADETPKNDQTQLDTWIQKGLSPMASNINRNKRIQDLERECKELKDETKSLRRKFRKLEEKVDNFLSKKETSTDTAQAVVSLSVGSPTNEITVSGLLKSVEHMPDCTEKDSLDIIKTLTLAVFSRSDLINKSRTGKRTVKCGDTCRPPLDSDKMSILQQAVLMKCKGVTKELFYKKLENLQKTERRSKKN